jgi:hypothetical protein
MLLKLILAFFLFTTPALSHSWYPSDCCSGKDCKPVECDQLVETRNGIVYKDKLFTRDKIRPTQDFNCHICMNEELGPLCVFTMPST